MGGKQDNAAEQRGSGEKTREKHGGESLELELIVVRFYLTVETLLCKQPIVSWPTTLILVPRGRFLPVRTWPNYFRFVRDQPAIRENENFLRLCETDAGVHDLPTARLPVAIEFAGGAIA